MSLLQIVALLAVIVTASAAGDWKPARASYYGMDGWSIHKGNCGFGYCWPDIGTGWDVAAIADQSPEFAGSCGRCYEVRCKPKQLVDGYGNQMDRTNGICKDPSASVVVRTVDSCPCVYPGNAYSNKRWCCGDNSNTMGTHFDLSVWAFEKLADKNWGVIGLEFRPVSCDYKPANPAPEIRNPTPGEAPPAGAKRPTDYTYVKRTDWQGSSQGAVKQVPDATQASGGAQVNYDSLFSGGGAFIIDPSGTSNPYAATKVLGSDPFSSTSASGSTSANSGSSSSSAYASSTGSSSSASAYSSSSSGGRPAAGSAPLVMAFNGAAESDGGSSSSQTVGDSSSVCTDMAPPSGTCAEQKAWGKCGESWMANYCAATCGRCSSSSPASPALSASSPPPSSSPSPSTSSSSDSSGVVYYKGFQNGFQSWSFGASFSERVKSGANGDQAACGTINQYGAFQAGSAAAGGAAGKSALQFWVDQPQDLTVTLGSQTTTCSVKALKSLGTSEQQAGFSKFYIPIATFGCPFGADAVTRVTIANARQSSQYVCVSDLRFL